MKYIHRTIGIGYVENKDGTRRPLTEEEAAVFDKALKRSLSECKEFAKPTPPPMQEYDRNGATWLTWGRKNG